MMKPKTQKQSSKAQVNAKNYNIQKHKQKSCIKAILYPNISFCLKSMDFLKKKKTFFFSLKGRNS